MARLVASSALLALAAASDVARTPPMGFNTSVPLPLPFVAICAAAADTFATSPRSRIVAVRARAAGTFTTAAWTRPS